MPIYPYSFQLPPLNVQDIPNDGVAGQFLGINGSGALDWLPVSAGGGDMLKSENLSGLADYPTARTNLGLGTGDSPTFKNLTISTGSIATSAPVTISQTWNAGSNAMTAFKVVATDTASGTASNFLSLDLSTNNVLGEKWRFRFEKSGTLYSTGNIQLGIGLAASASLLMGNGFYAVGGGNGLFMGSGVGGYILAHGATQLWRGSADHILEQRNSTAAQTFNVYGTFTTAITNFERLAIKYNATDVAYQIAAEKGSTNGDYRPLDFVTGGSRRMTIGTTGNVGIGTNGAPVATLEIRKDTAINGPMMLIRSNLRVAGNWASISFGDETQAVAYRKGALIYEATSSSANGKFHIALNNDGTTADATLADARLTVLPSGNVGIGTTAPRTRLHVEDLSANPALELSGTTIPNFTAVGFSPNVGSNTTGRIIQGSYANGGISILGITANTNVVAAVSISGYLGATSPTQPAIGFYSYKHNGTTGRSDLASTEISAQWGNGSTPLMTLLGGGNLGIGTTAPSSKLHVAGNSSPSITIDNTLATGYSQLLLKNTVVTGDTDGIFLNGSTQTGFGGAGSLNIKATTGPLAFHTATVTNALSIAQNGNCTVAGTIFIGNNIGLQASDSVLNWSGRSNISAPSAAIIRLLDNAQTNFNLLQFGGAAGFPGLKRVGAELQVVVASTTAAIGVAAADADMTFIEDRFRRKGAGSPEGAVTAPIGAVYHNTTGGAGTSFYVKESGTGNTGWVAK